MAVESGVRSASGLDRNGRNPAFGASEQESVLSDLWRFWKAYAHRASSYQSTILLSLVYHFVLGPSALLARLAGTKLLDVKPDERATYWLNRKPVEHSLTALERQF